MIPCKGFLENQGCICFKVIHEEIDFYFCDGVESHPEISPEIAKGNYTYVSMEYNASFTPVIVRKIVAQFGGGFIEERDGFESEGFLPVDYDSSSNGLPIIKMTQDELNKHFGGVVIVVD